MTPGTELRPVGGRRPTRVALVGLGAIGRSLLAALDGRTDVQAVATLQRQASAYPYGLPGLDGVEAAATLDELLAHRPDVVVECAGHDAVRQHGARILGHGADLVVASVGALADPDVLEALRRASRSAGSRVLVPGGALGGIDALAAARLAGLDSVTLRSAKPPHAWRGSAAEAVLDLDAVTAETVFFRGSARQAAHAYPRNANVAALVALAGIGLDATAVELAASPGLGANRHEIHAAGAFGELRFAISALASRDNPRTSAITAFSIAHAVLNRCSAIAI
ncbi:MAG TPA: aspartate dehydrogenase [Azospirillaceae bacterium]|nr:aspartate dehydrogenase [Azospirillaceae bacterium]